VITVIQRLREAIEAERRPQPSEISDTTGGKVIDLMVALKKSLAPQTTDARIAAVEQELAAKDAEIAELRRDRDWLSLECSRLSDGWHDAEEQLNLARSEGGQP